MKEEKDQRQAVAFAMDEWSKAHSQEAAQFASERPEGQRKELVDRVVRSWGRQNPQQAAEWVCQLSDEKLRQSALGTVSREWATVDPFGFSSWLDQQPPSRDRDEGIKSLHFALRETNAPAAVKWAESIQDAKDRDYYLFLGAEQWLKQDRNAALEWIGKSNLSAERKEILLKKIP